MTAWKHQNTPDSDLATLFLNLTSRAQLADLLGVDYKKQFVFYAYRHPNPYTAFLVKKRGRAGGTREIKAPRPTLRMMQARLARVFSALYKPRAPAHGFVKNRSIKSGASKHVGARYLLNFDFEDFFGSIHYGRVAGALRSLGAHDEVAKACATICCHEDSLPQGSPCSPVLSNIIAWNLDKQLLQFAQAHRCYYTRYADDVTFSTMQKNFPRDVAFYDEIDGVPTLTLGPRLLEIVHNNGFRVNASKTRLATRSHRQEVTGLIVNSFVNVDRRYVRSLRAALFSWERDGKSSAEEKFRTNYARSRPADAPPPQLEQFLRGRLEHLRWVKGPYNPVYTELRDRFNKLAAKPLPRLRPPPDPWISRLERAVWVIESEDHIPLEEVSQGTAFFLKGVGLVTCAHCVHPSGTMDLYSPKAPAKKYKATVKQKNDTLDLAVLEHNVPETDYEELELADREEAKRGETISIVGWPNYAPGDEITVRQGHVDSFRQKSGIRRVCISCGIVAGNSGGPAFDAARQLMGVGATGADSVLSSAATDENAFIPIAALSFL